ncbi:RHS repeat-associated core domain-containing protein [Kamptonema cortianum]|nr:RHS repeat-associated core domain-containing protein [Kamptonema cortianum]
MPADYADGTDGSGSVTPEGSAKGVASDVHSGFGIQDSEFSAAVFYTGKPYDEDLQSYHFLYRNYSPTKGRWTAADPSGFPDGPNQWLYVNNGVMNKVDPLGLSLVGPNGEPAPPGATQWGYGIRLDGAEIETTTVSNAEVTDYIESGNYGGKVIQIFQFKITYTAKLIVDFESPFGVHTIGDDFKTVYPEISITKTLSVPTDQGSVFAYVGSVFGSFTPAINPRDAALAIISDAISGNHSLDDDSKNLMDTIINGNKPKLSDYLDKYTQNQYPIFWE